MLLLVTNRKSVGGFFSRRRADKGKIPPAIAGTAVGPYMAARLELAGRRLEKQLKFLTPYRQRGDVLVASRALEPVLQYNAPLLEEYARRQCVNFCLAAMRQGERHRRLQVALIDADGECVGVAAELLAVCNTVWVATNRPELFLPCAAYTRQMYGTQPMMAGGEIPPVDLVIAPYGTNGFSLPAGVRTAAPTGAWYPGGEDLYIPAYVASLPATEVSPLALTAGLFAAFHPRELMEAVPAALRRGTRQIPVDGLV